MLPFNALGAFLMFRRHEAFGQRNVLVPIERCEAVKRDAVILINLMLKNLLGFVEGLNRGIACSLDGTGGKSEALSSRQRRRFDMDSPMRNNFHLQRPEPPQDAVILIVQRH